MSVGVGGWGSLFDNYFEKTFYYFKEIMDLDMSRFRTVGPKEHNYVVI